LDVIKTRKKPSTLNVLETCHSGKGGRKKNSQPIEFFLVQINGMPCCIEALSFNISGDVTASVNADAISHP